MYDDKRCERKSSHYLTFPLKKLPLIGEIKLLCGYTKKNILIAQYLRRLKVTAEIRRGYLI